MQHRSSSLPAGVVVIAAASLILTWIAAENSGSPPAVQTFLPPEGTRAEPLPGLDNLWRFTLPDGNVLYSGGEPDPQTGFDSLQRLGVKTILSVDGAVPDAEAAKAHGMRYVHVPIGYDDVPPERLATMAAAVRRLPGPVYLHCHHGQHRGPASAVCIWRALDARVTPEEATQRLRDMGTAAKYMGLYAAAMRPFEEAPDSDQPVEFPEAAAVPPLAEQMAGIDRLWDRLKAAGGSTDRSAKSPDDVAALLVDLGERFQEAARLAEQTDATADPNLVHELQAMADFLARSSEPDVPREAEALGDLLRTIDSRCKACHDRHRD